MFVCSRGLLIQIIFLLHFNNSWQERGWRSVWINWLLILLLIYTHYFLLNPQIKFVTCWNLHLWQHFSRFFPFQRRYFGRLFILWQHFQHFCLLSGYLEKFLNFCIFFREMAKDIFPKSFFFVSWKLSFEIRLIETWKLYSAGTEQPVWQENTWLFLIYRFIFYFIKTTMSNLVMQQYKFICISFYPQFQ